ncbi:MAG: hypothetical protein H0V17_10030 [Deltaproteobacteria bacterium]|nr:hypothetical protein [Deltaproteobacteria bacterium]
MSTHLEAASHDSLPRRSRAVPVILGLAVVLAIGGAIWFLARSTTPSVVDAAVAQLDAAPDAVVIVQAPDASVAPPDAESPDAPVIADAPPRVTRDAAPVRVPQDAPRAPPDAPIAPLDAAVETGIGKLIVKHHPSRTSYLDVFVDGKPIGKTPILPFKALPAGAHVVTLVAPATGAVVHREDIVIVDGRTTLVVQPAPP